MSASMQMARDPEQELSIRNENVASEETFRVEDLSVSFDGFRAVDNLCLSVAKNELRVIIGPNGAGKTTLLDMICGKTRPTEGKVIFDGEVVSGLPEYQIVKKGIGRKFQTPSVYEDLSVFENFEISMPDAQGVLDSLFFKRDEAIRERVSRAAAEVFLADQLHRKAGTLSHGQKQWLEIGMLLIQEPRLLLLDEPVAGMSPREREATAELLTRVANGRSVIVIEHDMDFVKRIAHKVTVLHQGRLLAEGSADEIQSNPKVIEVYLGH